MCEHNKHMARAIQLSIDNIKNGGGPFGAVIVKNDIIIAEGFNRVTENNDPTAHAEVTAIRNACEKMNNFDLSGCTIYTSCEPCPMCLGAIYWSKMDAIYFANDKEDAKDAGFDDQFIYEEIEKPMSGRRILTQQINDKDAIKAFINWKNNETKIDY